jgi:hypothetical protein
VTAICHDAAPIGRFMGVWADDLAVLAGAAQKVHSRIEAQRVVAPVAARMMEIIDP